MQLASGGGGVMDTTKLFDTTVQELERILCSKSVVGEPIQIDGKTIIPLVSVGVGFGVGGGESGAGPKAGAGQGLGTAGGGGVRPVAVLVVDQAGVRVESITAAASVIAKIAEGVTELARTRMTTPEAKKLEA
jgi:uncharacterized spore protein YtfJ